MHLLYPFDCRWTPAPFYVLAIVNSAAMNTGEQQTGTKLGKEYIKVVYYYPAYLTYMQRTSCKMLGWMKHKLDCKEKYQ